MYHEFDYITLCKAEYADFLRSGFFDNFITSPILGRPFNLRSCKPSCKTCRTEATIVQELEREKANSWLISASSCDYCFLIAFRCFGRNRFAKLDYVEQLQQRNNIN